MALHIDEMKNEETSSGNIVSPSEYPFIALKEWLAKYELGHLEMALKDEDLEWKDLVEFNDKDLDELCTQIKNYLTQNNSKLTLKQKATFKREAKKERSKYETFKSNTEYTNSPSNLDENRIRMQAGWRCEVYSCSQGKWHSVRISDAKKEQIYVEYPGGSKWVPRGSEHIRDIIPKKESEKMGHKRRESVQLKDSFSEEIYKRSITKYIGRIKSERQQQEISYGAGTVFDYDSETKNVFVITSAHNFMKQQEKDAKIYFQRIPQSENDTNEVPQVKQEYYCHKVIAHEDNMFDDHEKCPNNIAILIFKDKNEVKDDGEFYKTIFGDQKQTKFGDDKEWYERRDVEIYSSDHIDDNFYVPYSIWGYEKDLRLWKKKSKCDEENSDNDLHFRKFNENTQYEYNCVDIVTQQLGGPIVTELTGACSGESGLKGDKYGIIGIHTERYGEMKNGYGVALNSEKVAWINYVRENANLMDVSQLRSVPSKN